jgi:carboxypeptidase C (cathepsin A)
LGIYLAGGPGEASTYSALSSENGPCYVNPDGTDTIDNPWSFNNYLNMLYLDQPLDAGFSYSKLINGTYELTETGGVVAPLEDFDAASPPPPSNLIAGYGTFPDQSYNLTVKNTVLASRALWHVIDNLLSSFPAYDTTSKDINIIGNSWGGYYVPEFAAQTAKNLKQLDNGHPLRQHRVDSIGITNGCVDQLTGILGYAEYAHNNTYGVEFATDAEYEAAFTNFTMEGGCRDAIEACRAIGLEGDPTFTSNNATVNEVCMEAFGLCSQTIINAFPALAEVRYISVPAVNNTHADTTHSDGPSTQPNPPSLPRPAITTFPSKPTSTTPPRSSSLAYL